MQVPDKIITENNNDLQKLPNSLTVSQAQQTPRPAYNMIKLLQDGKTSSRQLKAMTILRHHERFKQRKQQFYNITSTRHISAHTLLCMQSDFNATQHGSKIYQKHNTLWMSYFNTTCQQLNNICSDNGKTMLTTMTRCKETVLHFTISFAFYSFRVNYSVYNTIVQQQFLISYSHLCLCLQATGSVQPNCF